MVLEHLIDVFKCSILGFRKKEKYEGESGSIQIRYTSRHWSQLRSEGLNNKHGNTSDEDRSEKNHSLGEVLGNDRQERTIESRKGLVEPDMRKDVSQMRRNIVPEKAWRQTAAIERRVRRRSIPRKGFKKQSNFLADSPSTDQDSLISWNSSATRISWYLLPRRLPKESRELRDCRVI